MPSSTSDSGGGRVGDAYAYASPPRSSKGSEDASVRVAGKLNEDACVASSTVAEGGVRKRVLSGEETGRATGRAREEGYRDSAGSGTSGSQSQESERKGRRRERRQVHLWEQL